MVAMQAWRDTGRDRGEASGWPRGGVPARVRPAGLRSLVRARGWPRPRLRRLEEGTGAHAMAACAFIKSPVGQVQPAPHALSSPAGACSSMRSRGGAGWDWQDGASISPPRPPPGALPLALLVPGLQAPSPASQPASVSARLGDGASTSPRSHSTHQSSRALARRRSGGHTESQGPLRYS